MSMARRDKSNSLELLSASQSARAESADNTGYSTSPSATLRRSVPAREPSSDGSVQALKALTTGPRRTRRPQT